MNTMKTLMIAGFTALSLGAGTAMAQEGPRANPIGSGYWMAQNLTPSAAMNNTVAPAKQGSDHAVQSGSSDRGDSLDPGMRNYKRANLFGGSN